MRESLLRISCLAMLVSGCSLSIDGASGKEFGDDAPHFEGDSETFATIPARGIAIREVEVNQGTRVVVGEGDAWVDSATRPIGLIADRDALVRVHYDVDPDWIPRPIEARLTLEFPDGSGMVVAMSKDVDGDSTLDSLDGGFWFSLSAAAGQTAAAIEYRVELWEAEDEIGDDLPELAWANPSAGPELIGFEAAPLEMKVIFVPIHYLPLDTTPMLDDAAVQQLVDDIYEQNPTNLIHYDVHPPFDYAEDLDDIASLLPSLSELKVAEGADANTYYHGLIDVGSTSFAGRRGIGNIVGDTEAEGAMRVAATVYWAGDPSLATETVTHELGHNQGLEHVSCPNSQADGIAVSYPHENGWIGNWGAGVRRLDVFAPDQTFDYMSYCAPSWVSDWTWTQTLQRITTLTAWDYQSGGGAGETSVLIGSLQADGRTHWWTAPGQIDPERAAESDHGITFVTEEGQVVEQRAQVHRLSDGRTEWIVVDLPIAFDQITTITHQRGDASVAVATEDVVTALAVDAWQPSLRHWAH